VSFQIDTDNREKFPSAIAFQYFRKQRDMFYEILKIWEDNHSVPKWNFQIALSGKIRTMLTMHTDVTNFTHFTRLFKSQMLMSCIHSEQQVLINFRLLCIYNLLFIRKYVVQLYK
jgi:codanin-1